MSDADVRTFLPRPIIGVGAVVWHDDQVLLIKRGKEPNIGSWSLPGGAQELGETLEQAVRREILEETGIEISPPILVDTVDLISPAPNGIIQYHYTLIDFTAEAIGEGLCAGGDVADAQWVDATKLAPYKLWNKTIEMIEKARRVRGDVPSR
ncbi:NUDIX hydrolase [Thalassospira lucentensis]|uniref:NUDIX hydrolase n=1 Tax=Thalassospira lucentensis TaxID=168935 RepID=UPI000426832A|nr:NUDIX hydrolase [Thalassospira lucentensis]RCK21717.1 NUDIX hydrolase [Thalassospira lucentensis MCCC 1A00383 = DSM 14000]